MEKSFKKYMEERNRQMTTEQKNTLATWKNYPNPKDKTWYSIQPTNEGQDLNYVETVKGNYKDVMDRAVEMRDGLRRLLSQGQIDVYVLNSKGEKLKKVV